MTRRYLTDYFQYSKDNSSAKESLERAFEAVGTHIEKLEQRIETLEKTRQPGGDRGR
jgi:hypothetical protein